MADVNEFNEEEEVDKKADKKAEKERKKAEKKAAKEAKKNEIEEMESEEGIGSKILIALVSLVIIVVWLGIFALLIKWDVGGFGSSVLYPVLKDVPYVNKILPTVAEPKEDDPYGYKNMDEAIARIKELEIQLANAKTASGDTDDTINKLQDEISRLKVFEEQQKSFEEIRTKFFKEVIFGEKAPDIKEYKTFYEAINPENAEQLYKQVISQIQKDEDVADYVKAYSEMKPKAAAAIMEKMTDDLELVAKILRNMKADTRGDILAAMNAEVAANLTKLMEP